MRAAFRIAQSGRKGPVLVDIPKDVTANSCEFTHKAVSYTHLGVALAATSMGIKSVVCMPDGAPLMKGESTKRLGAQVELVKGTYCLLYTSPEARCGYRNPTLSSILATQMPCRGRRSGA